MTPAAYLLLAAAAEKPKRAKFGNRKVVIDGHTFDSEKEGRRYGALKLMERAGKIRFLRLQERFPLIVGDTTVAHYLADFVYVRNVDDVQVIEDVKSEITRKDSTYRLKFKIMAAMGLHVVEV